jgi:hypothetical protein
VGLPSMKYSTVPWKDWKSSTAAKIEMVELTTS